METKNQHIAFQEKQAQKATFLALHSRGNVTSKDLNDTDPIHRYYKGLLVALHPFSKKEVSEFLPALVNIYQDTDLLLLKIEDSLRLFQTWRSNKQSLQLFKSFFLKIKTPLRFDIGFAGLIIQHLTLSQQETKSCYAKLFLIVKLVNQQHITCKNWENHVLLLRSIFTWDYSIYLTKKSTREIERIVSNHFHVLLFWFKNFKKHALSFEVYRVVYTKYYSWTSLKSMDIEQQMPLYEILQQKLPVDYMVNCCNHDFGKWQELFQWKPSLFENMHQQTTQPANGFDLLQSLFQYYTFSGVMLTCFFANENDPLAMKKDEKQWFIEVLQGKSLRKLAGLPCTVSKKAAHIFMLLPCDTGLTVKQAFIYSALLAKNVREDFAKLVAQRIYLYRHLDYWITTLSILFHKGLDTIPLYEVIDYISDQVFEKKRNIEFKTKKLSNLYSDIENWRYQLLLKKNFQKQEVYTFNAAPIKEFTFEGEDRVYRIVQIKNTKALYIEGQQMRHCVVTYNHLCADEICVIFSLRCSINNEQAFPCVTIEVRDHTIVQKRGIRNRECTPQEDGIIQIWANENRLKIA